MNKSTAKKIAEHGVTAKEIKSMLKRAYEAGSANEEPCKLNKGMSNAAAYNIFWKGYQNSDEEKVIKGLEILGAKNAIYVFGEYWKGWVPEPKKKAEEKPLDFYHEDPLSTF